MKVRFEEQGQPSTVHRPRIRARVACQETLIAWKSKATRRTRSRAEASRDDRMRQVRDDYFYYFASDKGAGQNLVLILLPNWYLLLGDEVRIALRSE